MTSIKPAPATTEVSEMAVVDTFTKLIFERETEYSADERAIIEALRRVDDNMLLDTPEEMGAYLKALGVSEMIKLVGRVVSRLADETPYSSPGGESAPPLQTPRQLH